MAKERSQGTAKRRDSQGVRLAEDLHALVWQAVAKRMLKLGQRVTVNSLVEGYVWEGLLRDGVIKEIPKAGPESAKSGSRKR